MRSNRSSPSERPKAHWLGNQRGISTVLTAVFDYRSATTVYRLARTPLGRATSLLVDLSVRTRYPVTSGVVRRLR